ncbi:MAG TPA: zinc ribbon domain-containing protein [Chloroflexi bacterium]|nr:zinc ribbon domain-containing protein [Chloroflexota bacterium]HBY08208.1 zinc ribbon domain-containing protein [Chloroflexota bacterium]
MPIYEYLCSDCDTRFEALRSMSKADAPIACQKCDGENTIRKVSAAFAHSGGRVVAGSASSSGGCGNCAGGSCGSCGH